MRKLLKFSAWGLACALALALVLFLALKFYFTPDRIRRLAADYAGHNLRREISLDAATLNLRGFSLRNLKVAEAGGFRKGEFLSAKDFNIRPDFRALLRQELQINSINASGVTLRILQVKKDDYNFSDLLAVPPPAAAKKPAAGGRIKQMQLSVSNITVRDSRIIYASADRSLAVTLSDLTLSARSLTSGELFPFEAGFRLGVRSRLLNGEFPVYARGKAALGGWDLKKGRAEIDKATLKAGNISGEFRGSFENLAEPDARIRLRLKAFSTTDLKPYFPELPARILLPALAADAALKLTSRGMLLKKLEFKAGPARGGIKGRLVWNPVLDYNLTVNFNGQTPELDTTEVARKFRSTPKNIKLPLADISANLTVTPGKIRLLNAGIAAKSLKATASGEFTMVPALAAAGSLKLSAGDLHDLGEMVPQLREYDLSGPASGSLDFSLNRTLDLRGRLSLNGAGAKAFNMRLSELKGSADFSKDLLKADAAGKLEGASFKASLTVKNYSTHPQAALNADIAALTLKPFETSGADTAKTKTAGKKTEAGKPFSFDLTGKTRLEAVKHPNFRSGETIIKYDLRNLSSDLSGLSGSASFSAAGGGLDDIQQLTANSGMARIIFYPFAVLGRISRQVTALRLPDFSRVEFTGMEGEYTFRNGVMKIERSQLRADAADADSTGNINLVSDTLDLNVITTLKAGISPPIPVAMTIKGPFSNPSVKPDISSLLKQPVIKDNMQKLLKGLFK